MTMKSAAQENMQTLDCLASLEAHFFFKLQYAKRFSNISNAKQDFEEPHAYHKAHDGYGTC